MSHVPGSVDTDYQPPMELPLAHFGVGVGFLLLGLLLGLLDALSQAPGFARLAHVHLLLVGWICVTILGAMTQFVPVWSGVRLHSRRLATAQLLLVAVGVLGLAGSLLAANRTPLPLFGGTLALGLWAFVYNVARTLPSPASFDVTERHFALALGYFALVPAFGLVLAVDLVVPVFGPLGLLRTEVVAAHATLAVFGAVLTTVLGALYQLATMFTQTELHGVDHHLRRIEEASTPVGVVALATGRLLGAVTVARVGGALLLLGLAAFGAVLARRLVETRLERTPMLTRYGVALVALGLWVAATLPRWLRDPTAASALYGVDSHLLVLGVVGFVVLGSLYHVVPFIVWVHRYSDRLGYEPVPMVDDLYDGRIAAADFWTTVGGVAALVAAAVGAPDVLFPVGGALVAVGGALFASNVALVVVRHGGSSLWGGRFGLPSDDG